MRKPFTKEELAAGIGGQISDRSIAISAATETLADATVKLSAGTQTEPEFDAATAPLGGDQTHELLEQLATQYIGYLLRNDTNNIMASPTRTDVTTAAGALKQHAGGQIGTQLIRNLYRKINNQLEKALGIERKGTQLG